MATKPTSSQAPEESARGETLELDEHPTIETVEYRRVASRPDDEEDIDSLGIGSITVADLAELLDDDSPTDEMPGIQDDYTFV